MIKQDSTSTILRNVGAFIAAFSVAVSYLGLPFFEPDALDRSNYYMTSYFPKICLGL